MASTNLTLERIAKIKFDTDREKARQVVWDSTLPGFGVRVQPSGAKTYVVLYRVADRKRLVKLGAIRDFETVEAARDAAREARRVVRFEDRDPIAVRGRKISTFADLVEDWLAYIKDKGRKDSYIRDATNRLKNHALPTLGKLRPQDVTPGHVDRIHRRLTREGKRMTANRVVAVIQAVFSHAARPTVAIMAPDDQNPAKAVERNPEKARKVFVRPTEMPALLSAIEAEADPYIRAFFLLALLTGARRGELLGLRWADVDLANRSMTFRDTKNREDHVLAISQAAVDILEALPRQKDNPFVLCGRKEKKALNNPDKPWNRIKARAELPAVHIHDLRRTYGSWLASAGRSTQQIGRTLGHKSNVTARVYAEIADAAKTELADEMAQLVEAARGAS